MEFVSPGGAAAWLGGTGTGSPDAGTSARASEASPRSTRRVTSVVGSEDGDDMEGLV